MQLIEQNSLTSKDLMKLHLISSLYRILKVTNLVQHSFLFDSALNSTF